MGSNYKKILLNDGLDITDRNEVSDAVNFLPNVKGKVVIKDEHGNVLVEKDNLVVKGGRKYVLAKIFNAKLDENTDLDLLKHTKVNLFSVGSGGVLDDRQDFSSSEYRINAKGEFEKKDMLGTGEWEPYDLITNPFRPLNPAPENTNLFLPMAFRVYDSKFTREDIALNPSYYNASSKRDFDNLDVSFIDDKNMAKYAGLTKLSALDTPNGDPYSDREGYMYKVIENEDTLMIDADSVEGHVFAKLALVIDSRDLRNKYINELGLFYSPQIPGGVDCGLNRSLNFTNPEMFSRVTFSTEPLTNKSKILYIEYFVYI